MQKNTPDEGQIVLLVGEHTNEQQNVEGFFAKGTENYPLPLHALSFQGQTHRLQELGAPQRLVDNTLAVSQKHAEKAVSEGLPAEILHSLLHWRGRVHILINSPGGNVWRTEYHMQYLHYWRAL